MMAQRNETIDAFRGVAIIAVLLFHYLVRWAPPYSAVDVTQLAWVYPKVLLMGQFGVQLFFVVSGLVIAMTLLRSRSVFQFAVNRFARLYPAFIVAATGTFLLTLAWNPFRFGVSGLDYLLNLTMFAHLLGGTFVDGVYWTLEVELLFYGFAALSWLVLKDRFWIALIALGFVGALAGPVLPVLTTLLIAPHLPFFLFGIALWLGLFEPYRAGSRGLSMRHEAIWPAGAALVLYAVHAPSLALETLPVWAPHLVILGTIATLSVFLATDQVKQWGPLSFAGRISYSLYLIHQVLGVTAIGVMTRAGAPDWLAVSLTSAVLSLTAWLMYRYVEIPAGRRVKEFVNRQPITARFLN